MDPFSANYSEARGRFRAAATRAGWTLESRRVEGSTPHGEELTVEIAVSPREVGTPTLLMTSGLHGVEGYFGSAVQLRLINTWQQSSRGHFGSTGIGIVLVHALNPYGFAWSRRTDAANRDLNRNFILTDEAYAGAPALYSKLNGLLNPQTPPGSVDFLFPRLLWLVIRYGFGAVQSAVASGQYEYPQGLFYGGQTSAPQHAMLKDHLSEWLDGSSRVLHLDLHTGLGRYAEPLLLMDRPLSARHLQEFVEWFGRSWFRDVDATNSFYQAKGSFGRWCRANCGVADYVYACADFGTYSPLRMLRTLRQENRCAHWAGEDSAAARLWRQRLEEVFCPRSSGWRRAALGNADELTRKAIEGLQGFPSD